MIGKYSNSNKFQVFVIQSNCGLRHNQLSMRLLCYFVILVSRTEVESNEVIHSHEKIILKTHKIPFHSLYPIHRFPMLIWLKSQRIFHYNSAEGGAYICPVVCPRYLSLPFLGTKPSFQFYFDR
uniref:Uncharacterized protein n=1 Tax=Rhizophora mucronata TaxID=61149 RepID=A0A2P2NM81_RHIMU